jgi:hypothetical protein
MSEKASVVCFKCQPALVDAVERAAAADFVTKSSVIRTAVAKELRQRGLLRVDFSEPQVA